MKVILKYGSISLDRTKETKVVVQDKLDEIVESAVVKSNVFDQDVLEPWTTADKIALFDADGCIATLERNMTDLMFDLDGIDKNRGIVKHAQALASSIHTLRKRIIAVLEQK